jgi:AraC-like DNA-binding protein
MGHGAFFPDYANLGVSDIDTKPAITGGEVALLFLEHTPAPPLNRFVRMIWYARVSQANHSRERILPTGNTQVIVNLARDYLLDCPEGEPVRRSPGAAVIGARSIYEIVDTSDMADLIGLVFEPGGFPAFAVDRADLFSNRGVDLEDVWGAQVRVLRDRLRELATPEARLHCFERFLTGTFRARIEQARPLHHCAVDYALRRFAHSPSVMTVRDVARGTGWSERRFSQLFREEVGLSPKVWCRIQRFQRAVAQLHAGVDVPWSKLALDCGFYDQSHFANEFRAFSGVDVTTYSARRTQWANHIAAGPAD